MTVPSTTHESYIPPAWKKFPFRAEPPRIVSYREYPTGGKLWQLWANRFVHENCTYLMKTLLLTFSTVNPGGNASVKIDPSKVDWHANDAKFVLASWINRTEYHIKYLELTNGVPGDENCYKDIDIRFQPCCLHFNISKCGQEFCIDISGITDSLAGTYIAYLYYLGTRYIPIYVYINVRIKGKICASRFL